MVKSVTGLRHHRRGFTLVEIMIIVALIGLLAVIAVPSFIKSRKRAQGNSIVNDARVIDAAVDQWALERGKKDGDTIATTEAAQYLKRPWPVGDLLNNAYVINTVGGTQIQINATTKTALNGVGIDWGKY